MERAGDAAWLAIQPLKRNRNSRERLLAAAAARKLTRSAFIAEAAKNEIDLAH